MAAEPGDIEFQSKLDEASKKKAKEELHELNEKDRELAVQAFRKWILDQPWLKVPTDFSFLLRFIRVRKYSQLNARQSFENYWTTRSKYPKWFRNVDPADKLLQEILRAGIYVVPKQTDKDGCRILIEKFGHLDIKKMKNDWGMENVFKAIIMVYDWIVLDENTQVNGIRVLSDLSDISMAMAMAFNTDQEAAMKYFTKALPVRMKGFLIYNEPSFFDVLYAMFAPFLSQKLKDRMTMMGKNMVKVYDQVPQYLFPDEYLPDDYDGPSQGPSSKLIEDMIADMQKPEFRNHIIELSSDKYGVDLEMKAQADKTVPVASFRKLNVD